MLNLLIAMLVAASAASTDAAAAEASTAPATEAASTEAPATPTEAQKPAKPKKICRKLNAGTGSRLDGGGKVCKTAEEWKRFYAE